MEHGAAAAAEPAQTKVQRTAITMGQTSDLLNTQQDELLLHPKEPQHGMQPIGSMANKSQIKPSRALTILEREDDQYLQIFRFFSATIPVWQVFG